MILHKEKKYFFPIRFKDKGTGGLTNVILIIMLKNALVICFRFGHSKKIICYGIRAIIVNLIVLESFINIKFGDIYIPVIIIRDCTHLTILQICI